MAAMTWTTLTGSKTDEDSIKRWVNSDKIDSETVIAETENWLIEHLRTKRLLKRTSFTISTTDDNYSLSGVTDYYDHLRLYRNGYGEMVYVDEDQIDNMRNAAVSGVLTSTGPKHFTIVGDVIYFDTAADQAYTFPFTYYHQPPALSASNLTNLWTSEFRALFKSVAMSYAYLFLKDEARAQALKAEATALVGQILEADQNPTEDINAQTTGMVFSTLIAARKRVGSIRSWVGVDVPSAEVITLAESWLAQRLRVHKMIKRTTVTLAADASSFDLTLDSGDITDFLDPVRVEVQGYGEVFSVPEDVIDELRGAEADGTISADCPSFFSIVGNTMMFDVKADQAYTVTVTHYFRPTPLSAANQSNLYTTEYPALFRMVLQAYGFSSPPLLDGAKGGSYIMAAEAEIQNILRQDDTVRRGQMYDVRVS